MKTEDRLTLVVTGHQRSGTTLLQLLCNAHPEMTVTPEFGFFINCHLQYESYRRTVINRWWITKDRALTQQDEGGRLLPLRNTWMILRYLMAVHRQRMTASTLQAIQEGLQTIFPRSKVVGDKYPDYIFSLERLASPEGPVCVVIYRDPRDVASSTLRMVRTEWKGRRFAAKMDSAEKIADRWLNSVAAMRDFPGYVYPIRYEDLVAEPGAILRELSERLGVSYEGFPVNWVKSDSVGKHARGLTADELAIIVYKTGSVMRELGYRL